MAPPRALLVQYAASMGFSEKTALALSLEHVNHATLHEIIL